MFKAGRTFAGAALIAAAFGGCLFPNEATRQVVVSLDDVPRLTEGDTVTLSAHVRNGGAEIPNAQVVFSVADGSVASVSSQGLLVAIDSGSTMVTASVVGLDGVTPAQLNVVVHSRVEVDSVSSTNVAFGDTLTLWGAGLDLASLYGVQLGGFSMQPKSYAPADAAHPERYGALTFWVQPPAGPQSTVQITSTRGSRVITTPISVMQRDRYEPNDTIVAPLTLPFYNPGLALEVPGRNDLRKDWYSFTLATTADVSVRIRSPYVSSGNVYSALVTDSVYWDGAQADHYFGTHAWAVGSGFGGLSVCRGRFVKWDSTNVPFQAPANVDIALGNLDPGTYYLYLSYSEAATIPIPYTVDIVTNYRSVVAADAFEENDYCEVAVPLSNALSTGGQLTIDNPLDVDWFQHVSPAGGETVVLQVDAAVDSADIDMYFVNPSTRKVIASPGIDVGPQDVIAARLPQGEHYFFTADYAGVPTPYTLSAVPAEHEPNDAGTNADTVTLQDNRWVNIWGVTGSASDVDVIAFHADSGGAVAVQTRAREFGSPTDTYLVIEDSTGNVLATDDDIYYDSQMYFDVPATGWYRVSVSSSPDLQRGGPGYFWVLQTMYSPPVVASRAGLRSASRLAASRDARAAKLDLVRKLRKSRTHLPRGDASGEHR